MQTHDLLLAGVRWMVRRDLDVVHQIETASFNAPWSREEFARILKCRNHLALVAELGEHILGYLIYQRKMPFLEIVNFAVHPDYRRRGVGTRLICRLIDKCESHYRRIIRADVRETNLTAQLFLRCLEFRAEETLSAYFSDTQEDAYRFEYRLDP